MDDTDRQETLSDEQREQENLASWRATEEAANRLVDVWLAYEKATAAVRYGVVELRKCLEAADWDGSPSLPIVAKGYLIRREANEGPGPFGSIVIERVYAVGAKENSARLAAAWNACAGLSTEALEAGAVADLLAACRHWVNSEQLKLYMPSRDRAAFDALVAETVAAIAKATGEPPK